MIGKTAKEVMDEFRRYIYLDTDKNKGCVIENWNSKDGPVLVRYANGRIESYNDIVMPKRMKVIGILDKYLPYDRMGEEEKEAFRERLEGLAKVLTPKREEEF